MTTIQRPIDVTGRTAIMQPYFFPYVGYYQLAAAVERFIFYDDVQFIKGGFIARNKLHVGGRDLLFTVPLSGASPNKRIDEVRIDMGLYPRWRERFLRTIDQNYAKAANFAEGRAVLHEVLELEDDRISTLAARSVRLPMARLGRSVEFLFSSRLDLRTDLKREERLFDICDRLGIRDYIQSQGGTTLYSGERWRQRGLSLRFLKPVTMEYPRPGGALSGLSMLDALLHVPFDRLDPLLDRYELFTN
ncbi:MAG: WbqC family protein [Flavobacteriales bacterium]|nr:WbqC family protein [Flavobacteriales bacterium]MCB9193639.1 WbqC family protein [Flavobacteriales bacterium]